jgi:lipopolysaccharide assembly outer membrane protein LptD (OstA)
VHYRDYILHADKMVYHQSTSVLEAEGHLQLTGAPTMCRSAPRTAI